jgi:tetratricopeptide (TPR) repeat protein
VSDFWHDPALRCAYRTNSNGAYAVWAQGVRGAGTTVALIDSGVAPDAIGGRVAWAVDLTCINLKDELGHGTEMAQLILEQAPEATIGSIKVFDASGTTTREKVIEALDICQSRFPGLRLANISVGFRRGTLCTLERPCALCARVNDAAASGMLVVAAAGNYGPGSDTLACPGAAAGAITIGATDAPSEQRWVEFFKRWLPSIYYGATGLSVGTSISTAIATGQVALLLNGFPDLALDELRESMRLTATVLARDPQAGEAHVYRAFKLIRHKREGKRFDHEAAVKLVEHAQALQEQQRFADAALALEKAAELSPTSHGLQYELAGAYVHLRDGGRAIAHAVEAVRLHWNAPLNHYRLGELYEAVGRYKPAEQQYRVAHMLDADLPERTLRDMLGPMVDSDAIVETPFGFL